GIWSQSPDEGARWERDLRATPAGFGESFTQMEERVLKFWATALQEWPDGELVVVSHRGPLVVLYAAIVGIALDVAWRDPFERGTAIRMDLDRAGVATPC
ncbi:MAG TPA: histidine phosphatase family protein, partial [Candidatus Dormibacteraeota bacterium]|nr:histidine phosphatase family protein [Candidatus Dormibacteraeota bacterium]